MNTFELSPVNGRKSFYGKCIVQVEGANNTLLSYGTNVAEYNTATKKLILHGWWSNTTQTHINSFLTHFGLPTMSKKEIEAASK